MAPADSNAISAVPEASTATLGARKLRPASHETPVLGRTWRRSIHAVGMSQSELVTSKASKPAPAGSVGAGLTLRP